MHIGGSFNLYGSEGPRASCLDEPDEGFNDEPEYYDEMLDYADLYDAAEHAVVITTRLQAVRVLCALGATVECAT